MRRFDGGEAGAPSARPQGVPPRRALRHRPQLAGLIAASLVVLVGVPVAWLALSRGNPQGAASADRVTTADIAAPPTAVVKPTAAPEATNGAAERDAKNAAPKAIAPSPAPQVAVPAPVAAPVIAAAPAPPPPAVVLPPPAAPSLAAKVAAPSAMRDMAVAGRARAGSAESGNIVVTANRVRRSGPGYFSTRGDWNACTIDDPRRSLDACRGQSDAGARGPRGEAGAMLAEGLAQAWQGEDEHAITLFDRAIALAPRLAPAWLNRGLVRARSGDSDAALADLDRAVRLTPGSARVHYARGRLLRERGDTRRAEADFARATELDPAYAELDD
jgi:tetratricopeptide (TPR) repeat protein